MPALLVVALACGTDADTSTSRPDTATGTDAPAALAIDRSGATFDPLLIGGLSGAASFVISNAGGSTSGPLAVSITGEDAASFTVVTSRCGHVALGPTAACVVAVAARPARRGPVSATLEVTASPGGTVSAALDGAGIAEAALALSASTDDLGRVTVGETAEEDATVIVSNEGDLDSGALKVEAAGTYASHFAVASEGCDGAILGAGERCEISVAFAPGSRGPKTLSLEVSATPGGRVSTSLEGVGLSAAQLEAVPAMVSFGTVVRDTPGTRGAVGVVNRGESPSGPIEVELTGSAAFEAEGCSGQSLAPGQECEVALAFAPQSSGAQRAELVVRAEPGGAVASALSGIGVETQLVIAPTRTTFSATPLGTIGQTVTFTITNGSARPSGALTTGIGGAAAAQFGLPAGEDRCRGRSLEPDESCTLAVVFAPDQAGGLSAELMVESPASGVASAGLDGVGLAPAELAITPSTQGFGAVAVGFGAPLARFVLDNVGDQRSGPIELTLSGSDGSSFAVVHHDCPTRLEPRRSCSAQVSFWPDAVAPAAASLDVSAAPGGMVSASLSGEGVSPGLLGVAPAAHEYPTVLLGQSVVETIVVTNMGAIPTGPTLVSETGRHPHDFDVSHDCPTLLAAAESCTLTVAFEPRAAGLREATVAVAANPGGVASVALSGRGRERFTVATSNGDALANPYDFGEVLVGGAPSPEARVIVTNNTAGAVELTLDPRFGSPSQFEMVGGSCLAGDMMVAADGGSCDLRVRFVPTRYGLQRGELILAIGSGLYDQFVWHLAGEAIGWLVIRPETVTDFGDVTVGTTAGPLLFDVSTRTGAPTTGPIRVELNGAGFSGATDCSGVELAAGASCTVEVSFSPQLPGHVSGTVVVRADPGGAAGMIIGGTGVAAEP